MIENGPLGRASWYFAHTLSTRKACRLTKHDTCNEISVGVRSWNNYHKSLVTRFGNADKSLENGSQTRAKSNESIFASSSAHDDGAQSLFRVRQQFQRLCSLFYEGFEVRKCIVVLFQIPLLRRLALLISNLRPSCCFCRLPSFGQGQGEVHKNDDLSQGQIL